MKSSPQEKWKSQSGETSGCALIFICMCLTALGIIFIFFIFQKIPAQVSQVAIWVVVISTIFGLVAWNWKTFVSSTQVRIEIRILEIISTGKGFKSKEIEKLLKNENIYIKVFPQIYFDSLSALLKSGRLIVKHENYYLPEHKSLIQSPSESNIILK